MAYLLLIFIAVPLIEIYFLIQISSAIGALTTIVITALTAIIGVKLVRIQGFTTLLRARSQMAASKAPDVELLEGVALVVAGALLLAPGFFTDAIGFILLTPPLRRLIIARIIQRRRDTAPGFKRNQDNIIDIDHQENKD